MVRSSMGSGGASGSSLTVRQAIDERSPHSVVAVGLAFGVDEKQPIGQVLVSERLSSYDAKRVGMDKNSENVIIRRGSRVECSPRLLSAFRDARLEEIGLEIKRGEILSGEALIDNPRFKAALLQDYPEAIGGEMEGAGVQAAAYRENTAWIVVKSVCDYAENKGVDKDARQALAALTASRAVVHILQSGAFAVRR
jgi:nucleoside phosphorylase